MGQRRLTVDEHARISVAHRQYQQDRWERRRAARVTNPPEASGALARRRARAEANFAADSAAYRAGLQAAKRPDRPLTVREHIERIRAGTDVRAKRGAVTGSRALGTGDIADIRLARRGRAADVRQARLARRARLARKVGQPKGAATADATQARYEAADRAYRRRLAAAGQPERALTVPAYIEQVRTGAPPSVATRIVAPARRGLWQRLRDGLRGGLRDGLRDGLPDGLRQEPETARDAARRAAALRRGGIRPTAPADVPPVGSHRLTVKERAEIALARRQAPRGRGNRRWGAPSPEQIRAIVARNTANWRAQEEAERARIERLSGGLDPDLHIELRDNVIHLYRGDEPRGPLVGGSPRRTKVVVHEGVNDVAAVRRFLAGLPPDIRARPLTVELKKPLTPVEPSPVEPSPVEPSPVEPSPDVPVDPVPDSVPASVDADVPAGADGGLPSGGDAGGLRVWDLPGGQVVFRGDAPAPETVAALDRPAAPGS
ncbi:MAG TPA: hypothetical protein VHA75_18565, partial [Rugosimonospora sp.]|nr:hypothetical protein [Rugosimonospora sp.]